MNIVGSDRLIFPDGLLLLDSSLGFTRAGKVTTKTSPSISEGQSCLVQQSDPYQDPEFDLKRFWSVEDLGKFDDREGDDVALQNIKSTIRFAENRYEVRWPWRDNHDVLPSNYGLAIGRLNSLITRLSTKPKLLTQYDAVISEQLQKGIIEPAPILTTSSYTHYLPHHCVVKPGHNTTKVRVVYDASAKASKHLPSLNDCLLSGPNLVPYLCGVLLRFSLPKIAVSSDIEKAFLQLSLHEEDRDVTRFLWLRDTTSLATLDNVRTFRFCRVPFGVVSSPFLLAATAHHHLTNIESEDAPHYIKNIYLDNLFTGADTGKEAVQKYTSAKTLFSNAPMNSESGRAIPPTSLSNSQKQIVLLMQSRNAWGSTGTFKMTHCPAPSLTPHLLSPRRNATFYRLSQGFSTLSVSSRLSSSRQKCSCRISGSWT